jgi:hypothetical protein
VKKANELSEIRDRRAIAKDAALRLLAYCRANEWAGYDPYDALNSRVFRASPFRHSRWARLALTQGIKRSPVNLRPLLLVPKMPNPKGIALFLSACVRLAAGPAPEAAGLISPLADKLLGLRSPGWNEACWGYHFDWQQRHALIPKGSPNIICTTFAANALLDAHERQPATAWVEAALSAADFILDNLFRRQDASKTCFRYTLVGQEEVHNANLLGAAFLCRAGRVSGEAKYIAPALEAARFSAGRQHPDGSWDYGESPSQRWIDNFHTGFNLVALRRIREYAGTAEFDPAIRKGFDFFKEHFVRGDGAPKYYHDATYPIDIHSAAQSIITLTEFSDLGPANADLAYEILGWALAHMWNGRGYFYFQKRPYFTVRTSFMRWSQAWMLWALATLLGKTGAEGGAAP